jgi:hypothetical protein
VRAGREIAGPVAAAGPAESRVSGLRCEEIAPVADGDPYPHYPAGVYEAQCVAGSIYRDPQFRAWKAMLGFRLVPGGEPVCGFFHMGRGERPAAGRRSNYWRAWVIANGDQPRRRQMLSTRVFKWKIFEVRIEDVTKRFDQSEHPEGAIYSTVKEILRRRYP